MVSSWFAWSSSPWGPLSDGGGHARPTSSLRHPCFLHPPNRHRRRPSTAHPKRTRRRCVLSAPRSIAAPQPSSPRPKRPRQCLAELPSSVDGSRSDDLSRSWAGEGRKALRLPEGEQVRKALRLGPEMVGREDCQSSFATTVLCLLRMMHDDATAKVFGAFCQRFTGEQQSFRMQQILPSCSRRWCTLLNA